MRPRRIRLLVAVALSVHGLALPLSADDEKDRDHAIQIVASPSILPKDARCRVELNPERAGRGETWMAYEGTIAKATDEGVMLAVTSVQERRVDEVPYASRIPYVGRLFRNIGIGVRAPGERKDVWIPSGQIRSVRLLADPESKAPVRSPETLRR